MDTELMLEMYCCMVRIRRFEEEVERLFLEGEIPGFTHLSIGQEAVAVGSCLALQEDDYITSCHRGHHYAIAKGMELAPMMAELFGKKTGFQSGKGGSMHVSDFDKGMLGGYAIVGGGIPVAAGAALACQMKKLNKIVATFFGDGGINTGAFHEALNVAAVWNLPILFICDNNRWAVSTSIESAVKLKRLSDRAAGYGIPGVTVDGNDVLEVWEAVNKAASRARQGKGPTLIEAQTYRMRGHFIGDPQHTVPREELEQWKKRCPIKRFGAELMRQGILSKEKVELIREEIEKDIQKAIAFARESPFPERDAAFKDVYGTEVLP